MATAGRSPPPHSITNAQQAIYDAAADKVRVRGGLGIPASATVITPVSPVKKADAPAAVVPSTDIELKTPDVNNTSSGIQNVIQSNKSNVLNKYRSFTYNFTLSALRKEAVNDPESYRNSALDLIILKSGGKGSDSITTNVSSVDNVTFTNVDIREGGRQLFKDVTQTVNQDFSGADLVAGFNKNSPGRFDMFIDNIDIESLMGFTGNSSNSLPTTIKFDIYEPYSINGFIEAIHVAAVAAGYPTYASASFLLKMEFIGYPDTSDISVAEVIPDSARYFAFGFTGVEVNITEKGTRYSCSAVPYNEKAFGLSNVLKQPIKMSGTSVETILTDFITNLNNQIETSDNASRATSGNAAHDVYAIKFTKNANGTDSNIAKSEVIKLLTDSSLYAFADPADTTKANATQATGTPQPSANSQAADSVVEKYSPRTATTQFLAGRNIHECIVAIIRDSTYLRGILEKLSVAGTLDEYGMLNYFLIKIEVDNLPVIDSISKRPFQKLTYVVSPYKVHYTRIPNYADQHIHTDKLLSLSLREYNYIYTGKNVDVTDFKLNFNTLYFEAIPYSMGNNKSPGKRTAAANDSSVIVKSQGDILKYIEHAETPAIPIKVSAQAGQVQQDGGNSGQVLDDPYSVLAKNMHSAIVNSAISMVTGELNILGDPFFLVTGGIGNYKPVMISPGVNEGDEAAYTSGEVWITVNFNNPVDIDSFNNGGRTYFNSKKVPFSGVYRVNKVMSSFKDGKFTQRLDILRIPGQILDTSIPVSNPADKLVTTPDPTAEVVTDVSVAEKPSSRPTTINLLSALGRGLPSSGLPGVLSNFTAATGGLGGIANGLINQVSGAVNSGIGQLTSAASGVFGSVIPGGVDQLASGIRLQASGLSSILNKTLSTEALIGQASNTLQSTLSVSNLSSALSNNILSKVSSAAKLIAVPGSGIGEGATVSVDSVASLPAGITSLSGVAAGLTASATAAVAGIGAKAAGLVNGISGSVAILNAANPVAALASKFGINPAQLSGLAGDLQSKVMDQATALAKTIPANVDLTAATAKGLILDYLPAGKLPNIPATAPYTTAPLPAVDQQFLTNIVKTGGLQALANVYGVSDISKISSNLLPANISTDIINTIPASLTDKLSAVSRFKNLTDLSAVGGKLMAAGSQLSGITGAIGSIEGNLNSVNALVGSALATGVNPISSVVSKFGSISQGTSPLAAIMTNKGIS